MTQKFIAVLTFDPDDDQADQLYGIVDDGTLSSSNGVARIDFHRDAPTMDEAIRTAALDIHKAGLAFSHVEIQADAIAAIA